MTSIGSGYGSGYGDGYGDGFYDSGYGSGYGRCTARRSSGYGLGYGDGYGGGYGEGSGDGYGSGVLVATLGEYEVRAVVTPWGRAARVGCQVHDLDVWREQWRVIAREHDVTVSAEESARLIALIEAAPMDPEWLPSEEGGEHG